jgi:hypothetical protein
MLFSHISKLQLMSGKTYSFAVKTLKSSFELVVVDQRLLQLKVSADVPVK